MFNNFFAPKDPALEAAIASVYADLAGFTAETEEHQKALSQLSELYALHPKRIDPNTVLVVLGNFAIGLTVLKYEQTGVITTKLWQFLGKMS